jgi:hypothetical protein
MTDTAAATPAPPATDAPAKDAAVKTPKQAKIEADAKAREADKAAADAQVAEDQAAYDIAKTEFQAAHDAQVKADAEAFDALNKAADIVEPPPADPTDEKAVEAHTAAVVANAELVSAAVKTAAAAKEAALETEKKSKVLVAAKDKLVASQAAAAALQPINEKTPWYYCLEHGHSAELKSLARFFQSADVGCPVCPTEKRQVTAAAVDGFGVYPPGILAISERLIGGRV